MPARSPSTELVAAIAILVRVQTADASFCRDSFMYGCARLLPEGTFAEGLGDTFPACWCEGTRR